MSNRKITKNPLSEQQIEALLECHERELLQLPPCTIIHPHIRGLLIREFVTPQYNRDENGRHNMVVYISEKGKQYLDKNL